MVELADESSLRKNRKKEENHGWDPRFGALFELISQWLEHTAGTSRLIAWEDVQFVHSRDQIMCWTSLRGAIWGACAAHRNAGVTLFPLSVGELKLHTSGAWAAPKEFMAACAVQRGWIPQDHAFSEDAVDAVCLLHLVSMHLDDPTGMRRKKKAKKIDRRKILDRLPDDLVVDRSSGR